MKQKKKHPRPWTIGSSFFVPQGGVPLSSFLNIGNILNNSFKLKIQTKWILRSLTVWKYSQFKLINLNPHESWDNFLYSNTLRIYTFWCCGYFLDSTSQLLACTGGKIYNQLILLKKKPTAFFHVNLLKTSATFHTVFSNVSILIAHGKWHWK